MSKLRFIFVAVGLYCAWLGLPASPAEGAFGGLVQARYDEEVKTQAARRGVTTLDTAIAVFHIDYGQYPDSLQMLAANDPVTGLRAIIEAKLLTDPWGRPYRYDSTLLHPVSLKPKIWSDGPPGRKKPIANW